MHVRNILIFLLVSVTMSACVPVVVVGVAGGQVMTKNTEEKSTVTETEAPKTEVPADPIEAEPLAPPKSPQEIAQPTTLTSKAGETPEVSDQMPSDADISELLNRGWQITLTDKTEVTVPDSVLYFDSSNNYFGFDGCQYFNGRYESKGNSQLLIKTANASAKNIKGCGNRILGHLIFIDGFNKGDNIINLTIQGKPAIALSPIKNLDVHGFLSKARFKNHRAKITTQRKRNNKKKS